MSPRALAVLSLVAGCGGAPFCHDAQACVDHINALRATKLLPPLDRWMDNEVCADGQARSSYTQVSCGFHITPDGRVWAVQDFR